MRQWTNAQPAPVLHLTFPHELLTVHAGIGKLVVGCIIAPFVLVLCIVWLGAWYDGALRQHLEVAGGVYVLTKERRGLLWLGTDLSVAAGASKRWHYNS
jgi:hypothetical protein